MHIFSTVIGKLTFLLLRLFGRSGSALPGLIVEKLNKNYLSNSIGVLPCGFVVITGTNGKTTTTKIVSDLARASGLRVLTNKTGSNFVRGVISATVDASSWSGKLPYDVAILEQDEAHAVRLVNILRPRGVVALNVMRDQLDRFGEIDTTAKLINKVVDKASEFVVLNTNDPRIGKYKVPKDKKVTWFGHSKNLTSEFLSDDQHHSSDELKFHQAEKPQFSLISLASDKVHIRVNDREHEVKMHLDGPHNALNSIAALAAFSHIVPEVEISDTLNALSSIEPAFGRGETVTLKSGGKLRVQLIKNPAGFTHSLKLLSTQKYGVIGIMINDNHPDGRDVSWLWDVTYSGLSDSNADLICGGTRGWDMAVRLKYDGIKADETHIDLSKFTREIVNKAQATGGGIVFCTYTAMLQLRGELAKYSDDVGGSIL